MSRKTNLLQKYYIFVTINKKTKKYVLIVEEKEIKWEINRKKGTRYNNGKIIWTISSKWRKP